MTNKSIPINRPTVKVNKLDAARRQLDCALRLWFADDDQVSVHTLVGSAYQVIHDLNASQKGKPLIFDNPVLRKDLRKEAVASLKRFMSFFKHADLRRPNAATEIDFDPSFSELFFFASVLGVEYLGEKLTDIESAFLLWCVLHRPTWGLDGWKEIFENSLSIENLTAMRELEKHELLKCYLDSRATRRALGMQ